MPKLSELLDAGVKNSTPRVKLDVLKFAYLLHIDADKAQALLDNCGEGYVYARGGFAMRKSARVVKNLVSMYGYCVVYENGELVIKDRGEARKMARKKREMECKREEREIARVKRDCKDARRTEKLFRAGNEGKTRKRAKTNGALRADDKREYKTGRSYEFTTIQ